MLNFGENVSFEPRHHYTPTSEQEVLAMLDRHATGTIRVAGSLHAWSRAVATDDVLIDLRHFTRVAIVAGTGGSPSVIVGGGCTLEQLVAELRPRGITLPNGGGCAEADACRCDRDRHARLGRPQPVAFRGGCAGGGVRPRERARARL
ncbi:MAG: FAD-binding protein [Chloroflexi bacterium]|nr:FAD-binding protein [Chloroflexota bacterium]